VKVGGIGGGQSAAGHILRVDRRVEEPDGRLAVLCELLIDQRNVSGPHWRGKAGSAIAVGRAGGLVRADIEGEVGVC
jgi:hypothetical protein